MRRFGWLVPFFAAACSSPPAPAPCDLANPCGAGQTCVDAGCVPACGPSNCSGCCSASTNACETGAQAAACGSGGERCQACSSCTNATCVGPLADAGTDAGVDAGTDAGTDGGRDGGPDGGADGGTACFDDSDCPNLQLFFCNTITSQCEPACRVKADCTAAVRGVYALPVCDNSPLGCQCDEGTCRVALCSSDSECGTQVCRNGACVAPAAGSAVTSCEVVPGFTVMAAGSKARFAVLAKDAAGAPVALKTGFAWSAVSTAVTGSGTGPVQEFTAGAIIGPVGPVEAVQVAIGAVSCRARVMVQRSPVPAGALDVTVIDELSGRPVPGASVLLTVPSTGAPIVPAAATDGRGSVQFAIVLRAAAAGAAGPHPGQDRHRDRSAGRPARGREHDRLL